ncbi:MAG: phosphoglucosamine mutase [Coriobacteriales bacterium]|jgi:phosphoglucosamine mutase
MSSRLFGTDGVRGVANTELTADLAFRLGKAAVRFMGRKFVIGKDTRRSGDMLESALVSGIMSAGGHAYLAGVIPTPAVALLVSRGDYDGGVVISASHNPPKYNGIKFFNENGFKLSDSLEDEMQAYIEAGCPSDTAVEGRAVGKLHVMENASEKYISNAIKCMDGMDLKGMKIAVDCAHGASCYTTPDALRSLGAEVVAINTTYTGDDINVDCGSTNMKQLRDTVLACHADLGLAHDGDADRLQAIDELGNEIDGDQIEAICAIDLRDRGLLENGAVVTTVMSNLGLRKAMEREGIGVVSTKVGDRYVLEAMRDGGFVLGGEQSGHTIFLQHNTTGDGLVTALNLLAALKRSGKTLHELSQVMKKFPQSLVNVPVVDKTIFETSDSVVAKIDEHRDALGADGNILVRASGTEKLIRVMVEAKDDETAARIANDIADAIAKADSGN